jgi:Fe-S-cluster containining protein
VTEHDFEIGTAISRAWNEFSGCAGCRLSCCIYKRLQADKPANPGATVLACEAELLGKRGVAEIAEMNGTRYLRTHDDGTCIYYQTTSGLCGTYENRPLKCRTHPFILLEGPAIGLGALCPNAINTLAEVVSNRHDEIGQLASVREMFRLFSEDVIREMLADNEHLRVRVSVNLRTALR